MLGYLSEVRWFAGNFAPRAWMFCEGQLLPISSNTALFSLIGTIYGGDGRTTFALPDFRGRAAIGTGNGAGLTSVTLGSRKGHEQNLLTINNLPSHTHGVSASKVRVNSGAATTGNPASAYPAVASGRGSTGNVVVSSFIDTAGLDMANNVNVTVGNNGGNQYLNNMQPSLAMNYIICVQGIFPSRS